MEDAGLVPASEIGGDGPTIKEMTHEYNELVPEAQALGIRARHHVSLFESRAAGRRAIVKLQDKIDAAKASGVVPVPVVDLPPADRPGKRQRVVIVGDDGPVVAIRIAGRIEKLEIDGAIGVGPDDLVINV